MKLTEPLPSLSDVARLLLAIGCQFMESGESARLINDQLSTVAKELGCDSAEIYCQHAAIIVTLRRGNELCVQMGKVGEHGVNLRRSEATRDIVDRIASRELSCAAAQSELDGLGRTIVSYQIWLVCIATGIACSAFGRLLGADWPSFLPIMIATAAGQYIRHSLMVRHHNVFIVNGIVSFVSALIAGEGARLLGSSKLDIATVSAVLLLVPGIAVVNIQKDAIEGKPNLAAARALRVLYLLLFMTIGLLAAQRLVFSSV